MKFFKNNRGYYFKKNNTQLVFFKGVYSIQMRLFKLNILWTLYKSPKKPRFRNLGIISMLFPIFAIVQSIILFFVLIIFTIQVLFEKIGELSYGIAKLLGILLDWTDWLQGRGR